MMGRLYSGRKKMDKGLWIAAADIALIAAYMIAIPMMGNLPEEPVDSGREKTEYRKFQLPGHHETTPDSLLYDSSRVSYEF